MHFKDFTKLTPTQQGALIMSMHIRNALEQFHGNLSDGKTGFITDEQMKLLNQTIRRAVFEVFTIRKKILQAQSKKAYKEWTKEIEYLIMCIPEYWEIATEEEFLKNRKQNKKELQQILKYPPRRLASRKR